MNTDSTTLATTSTFAPLVVQDLPDNSIRDPEDQRTAALIKTSHRGSEPLRTERKKQAYVLTPTKKIEKLSKSSSPQKDSIITFRFRLPPSINNSEVFNHQMLATFVSFFAKNPSNRVFNNWMNQLPEILSNPKSAAAKKSIVAAAMVHSAGMLTNKDILIEGYKWYGSGLSSQRKELEVINQGKRKPTFEELCTPLMLSFCEISCCTSQTAYFHHLLGAAGLLSKHGPKNCTSGVLFEMFQVLRFQLVSYSNHNITYLLIPWLRSTRLSSCEFLLYWVQRIG